MVHSDVIEYKKKLTEKLVSIEDIFTYIGNSEITKPEQMINKNIFPYTKNPTLNMTIKNYIWFDYNSITSSINASFKNCTINIGIVCHEDTIETDSGNRHDVLGGIITDGLNWSKFLGFELELVSDNESIEDNQYHIRTLQFKNRTPNSLYNKVGAALDE
ncbi:hypothetical protein [Anaerocolumna jejuensis]|uniref:hypothetical protein n=1 Tax=Anaerocolumna jejuensis TaxID=259063 RepID=UPI003F7C56F1